MATASFLILTSSQSSANWTVVCGGPRSALRPPSWTPDFLVETKSPHEFLMGLGNRRSFIWPATHNSKKTHAGPMAEHEHFQEPPHESGRTHWPSLVEISYRFLTLSSRTSYLQQCSTTYNVPVAGAKEFDRAREGSGYGGFDSDRFDSNLLLDRFAVREGVPGAQRER